MAQVPRGGTACDSVQVWLSQVLVIKHSLVEDKQLGYFTEGTSPQYVKGKREDGELNCIPCGKDHAGVCGAAGQEKTKASRCTLRCSALLKASSQGDCGHGDTGHTHRAALWTAEAATDT